MNVTVTALGAVIALVIAITLIIKKVHPAYGLILGALIGGLVGGAGLTGTVNLMMDGAKNMMPAILRILTAGVLAGVLIESGAAAKIAETIVEKIGESRALIALAIATMVLTMVGVFVDVSVITVSPIALAIAHKSGLSKPAIFGVIITCILASRIKQKGSLVESDEHMKELTDMPGFLPAMVGPLVAIILLMLRPIAGIAIDPLIALPVGGICGILAMGKIKHINKYATYGLAKMSGVAILLIGTGTLAGIIANSGLKDVIISGINALGLPSFMLAPVSGILMSAATASTTSGTAVATSVFGPTIVQLGVAPLATAAMIHAGATVLDHLPHGSFFHATGGSVSMDMKERLKLIPYESLVGLTMTIVSTIIFGIILK
ncbi:GntP family permease [Clostridium perfringens]|uniref:GntP family permease n=1 Tax=Clostridium perfringens TaxID=1502 RepID=UPI0024BC4B15|nr:Na+/H+ antiporter NhaC family protein [Clostridium perfringens]